MDSVNSNSRKFLYLLLTAAGIAIVFPLTFLLTTQETQTENNLDFKLSDYEYLETYDNQIRNIETDNKFGNNIRKKCGFDNFCTVEEMQKLSKNYSSEVVLTTLKDLMSSYDQLKIYCHPLGHHLGEFLYGYVHNLREAISLSDRACGGSLYHGIFENYIRAEIFFGNPSPENLSIRKVCDELDDLHIQIRTECYHGVGHALAIAYDFDVFSAVKRCDEFDDDVEKKFCHEGVFMENTQESLYGTGGAFDESDIYYPCSKVGEEYIHPCMYHHATYISKKSGSPEKAFQACDKLNPQVVAARCYLGLGRHYSAAFFEDMENLKSVCQLGTPGYLTYCYAGAMLAVLDDQGTEKGLETCKAFPEEEKNYCYSIIGKWIYESYSTEDLRLEKCSEAENDEYYDICISQKV